MSYKMLIDLIEANFATQTITHEVTLTYHLQ
jgi:hypothetical protein